MFRLVYNFAPTYLTSLHEAVVEIEIHHLLLLLLLLQTSRTTTVTVTIKRWESQK